jgi:hypothetical protein
MSQFYDLASLVVIPSGYKASTIYAQKPLTTDGQLSFSRASGATRVASNGLIEKVRTNLLTYSNTFSNAAWLNDDSTETSGQTGYDGTTNAWLLSRTGANGRIGQVLSVSGSATFSIYVKAGTKSWVKLASSDAGVQAFFNLSTGAIGTAGAGTIAKITSAGNGYYRCSISGNASFSFFNVWIADADNDTTGATGTILIQDSQVETGDIATDYIPTTTAAVSVGPVSNVPRLDYTNSSCPRLLLEPQRTNLTAQSEDFNGWATKVNVTTTANYAVSPDGYTNADRLQFTGNGFLYGNTGFSQTSGTVYTLSCYAKRNGSGTQSIGFFVDGSGGINSAWTLSSNWQRFTYTYTAGNTSTVGIAAASGADVSVYGFQFEAGNYATSYIPTPGASSVTRVADAASKTGISSLIGQTEGTLFAEVQRLNTGAFSGVVPIQLNDGTNNNRAQIEISSAGAALCIVSSGGSVVANITGPTLTLGQTYKIAITYKVNDFKIFVDGVLAGSDTSGAVPVSMSRLDLASEVGVSYTGFALKQALHFKTALTNAQLAELTTL